jgi:hypothetical protein
VRRPALGGDLGDFQTPTDLVASVLDTLGPIGRRWPRVLEPTCGRGHFLAGLLGGSEPPREIVGIEIQEAHVREARGIVRDRLPAPREAPSAVTIVRASLFDLDLRRDLDWRVRGPLLVVGNPPWVTNAALGVLSSGNLPRKWNVKGSRGLDARTGAANFDIAEAVWFKLLDELAVDAQRPDETVTMAMLCKMSVARGVLEHADRRGIPIAEASLSRIDARRWFGAEVEACLFRLTLGCPGGQRPGRGMIRVPVLPALGAGTPAAELGFARGRLMADIPGYERHAFADGVSSLTWRQGVKHDAAAVMELGRGPDPAAPGWRNKLGMPVEVEPDWLYPLLKGADLARPEIAPATTTRRAVIVTQTRIGQDTRPLEQTAPRLWAYLSAHAAALAGRKSSIYRGRPPFAIFGIGPYSFAPYKVAVSGLHKAPRFHAIGPVGGRPVMVDDTAYFVACATADQAALVAAILDDESARGLLACLSFADAKRPITKAILQRLDLAAIAGRADRAGLLARADIELGRLLRDRGEEPASGHAWPASLAALLSDTSAIDENPPPPAFGITVAAP